jgi:hypothetical protein
VKKPFTGTAPPVPVLVAIRTGTHPAGGYDRIAYEFKGQAPGYSVQYQPTVSYDGSGAPVKLTGAAFLQVVFNPAQAHNENGESTLSAPPLRPVVVGGRTLRAHVLNGDYEGYVSSALGLTRKAGFRVGHIRKAPGAHVVYVDVQW